MAVKFNLFGFTITVERSTHIKTSVAPDKIARYRKVILVPQGVAVEKLYPVIGWMELDRFLCDHWADEFIELDMDHTKKYTYINK